MNDPGSGTDRGDARGKTIRLLGTNASNCQEPRVLVEHQKPLILVHDAISDPYTLRFSMHQHRIVALLASSVCALIPACAPEPTATPALPLRTWHESESGVLRNQTQLTFPAQFVKAGEAYFSPDGSKIVFQAIEQPSRGGTPEDFYAMFVADLTTGPGAPSLSNIRRISPAGSANTCGWFDASHPGRVIFGSTIVPPSKTEAPGFQRGTGRYRWQFPPEMRIVALDLDTAPSADGSPGHPTILAGDGTAYAAECSTTSDGRWLLYCTLASGQGDIVVKDLLSGSVTSLVTAPGYDGGPFFSNDGTTLCYRSDRHGDSLLQIHVCEVVRDASGAITGTRHERQLTANEHVNWAPYWSPDDAVLLYASSEIGHDNYEIFAVDAGESGDGAAAARTRVTQAAGADVLPVFDPSGTRMMWTSQRGEGRSSQLWIAELVVPYRPSISGSLP